MKKKIILIITSAIVAISVAVFFVFSLTKLIKRDKVIDPIETSQIIDVSKEENVLIEKKSTVKTRFYVGDSAPNFKEYFTIYENYESVEVLDDYITTDLNLEVAGNYMLSCVYKNVHQEYVLVVEDLIVVQTQTENLSFVEKTSEPDFKTYFSVYYNGKKQEITDDMLISTCDFNNPGDYYVSCTFKGKTAVITVVITAQPETPDTPEVPDTPEIPDNPNTPEVPDTPNDNDYHFTQTGNVKIGVSKNNEVPLGKDINVSDLIVVYKDEVKLENLTYGITQGYDKYLLGEQTVKCYTIIDGLQYDIEINIVVVEPNNSELPPEEIDKIEEAYKTKWQDYGNIFRNLNYEIRTNSNGVNYLYITDDIFNLARQNNAMNDIFFIFNSDNEDDVLTISYLAKWAISKVNSSIDHYSGPYIHILDVNSELEKNVDNEAIYNALMAIKNKDYTKLAFKNYSLMFDVEYNNRPKPKDENGNEYEVSDTLKSENLAVFFDGLFYVKQRLVVGYSMTYTTQTEMIVASSNYTFELYENYLENLTKER